MRELIIHLGYPKTGTTSIQEVYFKNLNDRKLISYKGKNVLFNTKEGDFYNRLFAHLMFNDPIPNLPALEKSMINVFSNEGFLWDGVLFGNLDRIGKILKFEDVIESLYVYFKNNSVKVKFVITIRNQVDLLYSTFLHNAYTARVSNNFEGFSSFVSHLKINNIVRDHYDFYKVYEKILNKVEHVDIKLLCYEDLKNNPRHFYDELSCFLGVNRDVAFDAINVSHKFNNNKKYSENKTSVSNYNKKKLKIAQYFYQIEIINKGIELLGIKSILRSMMIWLGLIKITEYSKPTKNDILEIKRLYSESNFILFQKIKAPAMKKYGYFDLISENETSNNI